MPLKINNRKVDGVTVLDLSGRIILGEETSALRETLRDLGNQGEKKILLNLAGVIDDPRVVFVRADIADRGVMTGVFERQGRKLCAERRKVNSGHTETPE